MSRFAAVLQDVDRRLDIPQPARSRVILEIQADMEDLYRHHRAQGLDDAEAQSRTIAEFDLTPDTIAAIGQVHASRLASFLDRFSVRTRSIAEKIALTLTMLPVLVVGHRLVHAGGVIQDCGIWIWPLLAGSVVAIAAGLAKWYGLYVIRRHDIRAVRRHIDLALYIAVGQLAIGFVGTYFDLFQTWTKSAADKALTIPYLTLWLQRSSALLSVALVAALISGMVWLVNAGKAASIAQDEADLALDVRGENP